MTDEARLLPHQRRSVEAVIRLLESRRGALLIDPPGSGKSWVAATVASLWFRKGYTIDLVVPGNLVPDWRSRCEQFGFAATFHEHESFFRERFVPSAEPRRLVIVDEAHHFRNRSTRRFRALASRSIAHDILLVTATPLWNSIDECAALLSLLAPDDAFRSAGVFSLERAVRDRDVGALAAALSAQSVRSTDALPIAVQRSRRIIRFGGEADRRIELVDRLRFPPANRGSCELLRDFLLMRLSSGPLAFAESVDRQIRFCERAIEMSSSGEGLSRADFVRHFRNESVDAQQSLLFPALFASESASEPAPGDFESELAILRELKQSVDGEDEKAETLVEIVKSGWNRRWLIFTSAVATAIDLERRCRGRAVALTHHLEPRASSDARLAAIEAFRRNDLAILIVTDWGSEGLNLQCADDVVHYDLPWNAARMEQRNARAVRLGRRDPVREWIFISRNRRLRKVARIVRRKRGIMSAILIGGEFRSVGGFDPEALPPSLPDASAQAALIERIERTGFDRSRWSELLLRRYRAGLELLMYEMSRERLTARSLAELSDLIEVETVESDQRAL